MIKVDAYQQRSVPVQLLSLLQLSQFGSVMVALYVEVHCHAICHAIEKERHGVRDQKDVPDGEPSVQPA